MGVPFLDGTLGGDPGLARPRRRPQQAARARHAREEVLPGRAGAARPGTRRAARAAASEHLGAAADALGVGARAAAETARAATRSAVRSFRHGDDAAQPRRRAPRPTAEELWATPAQGIPMPAGVRAAHRERARQRHRPDVEGLRGVCVLLVVAFHAGLPLVPGGFVGVDVFFVISGFLITGLLVDELRSTGTVSLTAFYARRARRLLPMACLVLAVTALVFRDLLAPIDRPGLSADIRSAAVWISNWRFAAQATNYFSDGAAGSPVLHYWSLSVEEQFYLLMPLLVVGVVRLRGPVRRWRHVTRRLTVALVVVAVGSFLASALTSASAGPWAYFGLHTRAWELAAGGLLAVARPRLGLLRRLPGTLLAWAGLALVIGSALLLDGRGVYPGTAALWPVLGGIAVVAGGTPGQGAQAVLGSRWLTYVGRLSYALYLWHWPCLAAARLLAAPAPSDDPDLPTAGVGPVPVVLAVVAAFALSAVSHRLVERPLRTATWLTASRVRSLAVGTALLTVAMGVPALALGTGDSPAAALTAVSPVASSQADGQDGAAALPAPSGTAGSPSAPPASTSPRPAAATFPAPGRRVATMSPSRARADDTAPDRCFIGFAGTAADPTCRFGDPGGRKVVVLIGDSHAGQWFAAMQRAARQQHWTLWFWAKSGCGYADTRKWLSAFRREYSECDAWRQNVLDRVDALPHVDAVVVGRNYAQIDALVDGSGNQLDRAQGAAAWSAGARRTLDRLRSAVGASGRLVLLRDTPRPVFDVPACLSSNPGNAAACQFPRDAAHLHLDAALFAAETAALDADGVQVVDLTDVVCSTSPCASVSPSGAIMFRDSHHLTSTFSAEIGPALAARLSPLVG